MTLRVGFDGRDLLRKRTGVVNYAVHLARHMAAQREGELVVYADTFVDEAVTAEADVPLRRLSAPPLLWKHAALPLALLRDRAGLFHSPTGTLPLVAPCPRVVTVHDLFAELHPEWFTPRVGLQIRRAQRWAARAARVVIAVSENTRKDVIERYRVPPARVAVVHNGVDGGRFHPTSAADEADAVRARFGPRGPFILCVGSLMPWRNAARLLEAVASLRQRLQTPVELLFVGRDIWHSDPTERLARQRGWTEWTSFAGYASDDDLPALYRAASVFAYPSLYEGFGIPPLEAMACGTPVVTSTAGALPEVAGDAALLVDPFDVAALSTALERALADHALRTTLRARGLERSARYTWERAARETWDVYQRAVE